MTKRTYETGSIQDLGGGKYRLRVYVGRKIGGGYDRRSKTITAKSLREAERALREFDDEANATKNDITVTKLIDAYMEDHVIGLKPYTQKWYRDVFRRVRIGIGHYKLSELKPSIVERFYRQIIDPNVKIWKYEKQDENGETIIVNLKPGISSEKALHHHRAICAALNWALHERIAKESIASSITPPVSDSPEKKHLYDGELVGFVDACAKETIDWQAYMSVSIETGARPEEICGIAWADINKKTGEITLSKSLQYLDRKVIIGDLKTEKSYRVVQVSQYTLALILEWETLQNIWKEKAGVKWRKSDHVFTTKIGKPRLPTKFSQKASVLLKKANIQGATLYSLRHTSVTKMLAERRPVADVAAYHGHSSPRTTYEFYAHKAENYVKDCAAVMDISKLGRDWDKPKFGRKIKIKKKARERLSSGLPVGGATQI